MKSFIQSTSNDFKINTRLGVTTLVSKSLLPIDSTKYARSIVPTYMFDTLTANPGAIYSVRKVKRNYTGPCFLLRRSIDNIEQSFGFLNSSDLDVESITTFAGGNSVFVKTWYDQSGNGNDITQTSNGSQPPLIFTGDAGSNSKPYVFIGNSSNLKLTNTNIPVNVYTEAILATVTSPQGNQSSGGNRVDNAIMWWGENDSWGTVSISVLASEIAWRFGTGQSGNTNNFTRTTSNLICSAMTSHRNANELVNVNGVVVATAGGKDSTLAHTGTTLLVGGGDGGNTPNNKCCELLFLTTAPTNSENIIWLDQKAYFGL